MLTDGRRTDDGVTGILLAHPWAFGSGELKMWYVRPAKPQISLHIRAVWSEPSLGAWIFYDCLTIDWTPLGVSGLKRRLQRLIRVYTCQNATLLEISFTGSNVFYCIIFNSGSCRAARELWPYHFSDIFHPWRDTIWEIWLPPPFTFQTTLPSSWAWNNNVYTILTHGETQSERSGFPCHSPFNSHCHLAEPETTMYTIYWHMERHNLRDMASLAIHLSNHIAI